MFHSNCLSKLFLKPFGLVYSDYFILSLAERFSDVLPEGILLQFKTITAIASAFCGYRKQLIIVYLTFTYLPYLIYYCIALLSTIILHI